MCQMFPEQPKNRLYSSIICLSSQIEPQKNPNNSTRELFIWWLQQSTQLKTDTPHCRGNSPFFKTETIWKKELRIPLLCLISWPKLTIQTLSSKSNSTLRTLGFRYSVVQITRHILQRAKWFSGTLHAARSRMLTNKGKQENHPVNRPNPSETETVQVKSNWRWH